MGVTLEITISRKELLFALRAFTLVTIEDGQKKKTTKGKTGKSLYRRGLAGNHNPHDGVVLKF